MKAGPAKPCDLRVVATRLTHRLRRLPAVILLLNLPFGLPSLGAAYPPPPAVTPTPSSVLHPANRLAAEKSPYLLQHQFNPVDWYPWGREALDKARREQKPIFLSIGYSTCHWCHVMERESFEDPAVAEVLNRHFVAIKVDREERPDIDKIYMTYVQAAVGSGGWPLNVFLTPDLAPFHGGTYWPPSGRQGRPGFIDLLNRIAALWAEQRADLEGSARALAERLRAHTESPPGTVPTTLPRRSALDQAARLFTASYDPRHGGFGGPPKFPRPSLPIFLLRHARRTGNLETTRMVLHTCDRMAAGGLQDQLGGGFARYAVDSQWLVPHFEKMLYDNAQLVQLYLDAHLASGNDAHAAVVRATITYVLRDLTHSEGGFFSAEDADSEGQEGKFYCWTRRELETLLTPREFTLVLRRFGITESGNFEDHSHPQPLKHLNVLSLVDPTLKAEDQPILSSARDKMWARRASRVRPHRDDKVLASWNGLMLGAMARAAVVLDSPVWMEAAKRNLRFLQSKLWEPPGAGSPTGTLHHRWRDDARDSVQLLEAYACLLDGSLHVYEATLEPDVLGLCLQLADAMLARFQDPTHGGFWQAPPGTPGLILGVKDDYDGAEPSANSVATLALLRLAAITDRRDYRSAAEGTLRYFSARLTDAPQALPCLLQALDFALEEPTRVVIAGDPSAPATRSLLQAAHAVYLPNRVILGTSGAVDPFARTLPTRSNRPTAYVCTGTACQAPVQEARALGELLRRTEGPSVP